MPTKQTEPHCTIAAGAFFYLACALLFLPLKVLLAWGIAVCVHEAFHIVMLRICQCRILGLQIGLRGIRIQTEPLSASKELLCASAGPAGSLMLIFLRRYYPLLALCGLLQGLFNLLPVYPSDGGRMLRSILSMIFSPDTAVRISQTTSCVLQYIILGVVTYVCCRLSIGILPVCITGFLMWKRKIPCKEKPLWYNRAIPYK